MEGKTFKAEIDQNGKIAIPINVFKDLHLTIGDTVAINYKASTEPIEDCLNMELVRNAEDIYDNYFCIPRELLESCDINTLDGTAHILCYDREITITNQSKMLEAVPKVIRDLCQSLNITDEQLANALAEGYEND